jgi:hypothetical protein
VVDAQIQSQLLSELERLPVEKQRQVLDFAQKLATGRPRGADLEKFAGILSPEEAEEMLRVIEEGCGQINPDEWQTPS